MQALRPGLQLGKPGRLLTRQTPPGEEARYAFNPDMGYLTACPTNIGTGIRVSAMLHCRDWCGEQITLSSSRLISSVWRCAGFMGKGTEALGNVFQVSNQMTWERPKPRLSSAWKRCWPQIIEHEENAGPACWKEAQMVYKPHRPRVRNPGQRAQHSHQGNNPHQC